MYKRIIDILSSNSFFLFGARETGKTTLLREVFAKQNTFWIDLLLPEDEELYSTNPDALIQNIDALPSRPEWVIIDEIQKAPKLLDVVHYLIERPDNKDKSIKFALTGSCARKLKKGAANLLAGRAFTRNLYPLTFRELGYDFNLINALAWGTLPPVINAAEDSERSAFLKSYTNTFLKEEIIGEQLIRSVVPFRKFLPIAGQCSGTIMNYNNIAKDIGADWSTVRNYFEILEDTLIGFQLPAYSKSLRKQQLASPKFYLFDLGVKRALDKTLTLQPSTGQMIGPLFEHFIIAEMHRLNDYLDKDYTFSYLTTQGGLEIDLIVERPGMKTAFIEIKSSAKIIDKHLRHLRAISNENKDIEAYCFCQEKRARKDGEILIVPWKEGFERIGL
ncbi:MAG: ATP-binding protein [Planctomycetota bacterium]|jgi:predicted AAA+ superfamily ATPase